MWEKKIRLTSRNLINKPSSTYNPSIRLGHYKYTMHNAITITKESAIQNPTLHTSNLALRPEKTITLLTPQPPQTSKMENPYCKEAKQSKDNH